MPCASCVAKIMLHIILLYVYIKHSSNHPVTGEKKREEIDLQLQLLREDSP